VAEALKRMEVSAFGHFLDDLLSLCVGPEGNGHLVRLANLRDLCRQPDVMARPAFADLCTALRV